MTPITFINFLRGIFKTKFESGTVHTAVIQSMYDSFIMADNDLNLFRLELCLSTASGIWLDYWGDFFTVQRKLDEEDEVYAKRIIDSIIKPKTTIPALKSHIVDFLNEKYNTNYGVNDVSIKEPWQEIGKLSHKGILSDSSRFFSGDYYSHAVMDISIPEEITDDLVDLIMSIKAAGVKIVWSFLNTYDVIKGFEEANNVWGDHSRQTYLQTQRNTYGGLVLSNSSNTRYLSGRREIWFELTTSYYWYAKMWDRDTDHSMTISKLDLAGMLEYFNIDELVTEIKDSGAKLSINNTLSGELPLSGDATVTRLVEKTISLTEDMISTMKFIDDWMTLSQTGKLSQSDGVMFKFEASHELYCKIMKSLEKFKKDHIDFYNSLQSPIITAEHVAQWYAARNNNWLFDTPTMSMEDFYELWEMTPDKSLQDIYDYELESKKKYLTFGDVYQPPIVIAGSPWDWTPILDTPWLWNSATLNNSELEEIYRRKFSGFPDLVEIETQITTHPETNLVLSQSGVLSPYKYSYIDTFERDSMPSLRLSEDGKLNDKVMSGQEIKITKTKVPNEEFNGYTYLSGNESIITKHKIVTENMPTLGTIIEFEENQDLGYQNEKIEYSTREWFQAPVQVGNYALWLILPNVKQLWNTIAITNEEIRKFWNSPEGTSETVPEDFEDKHVADERIYQPPIVRTDTPFYWSSDHTEFDSDWLWDSSTLTLEDLPYAYLVKFANREDLIPDLVTYRTIIKKTPEVEFRLSDNGYLPNDRVEVETSVTRNPESGFMLSTNSLSTGKPLSGEKSIVDITHTLIPDENGKHYLSGTKFTSYEQVTVEEHPITLGAMIQLEDEQRFKYSLRDNFQSPIQVNPEHLAQWKVNMEYPILWDTPVMSNMEIMKFSTHTSFVYLKPELFTTPYRFQPPTTISPQEDLILWSVIKMGKTKLWNTPAITNEEILKYWEGEKITPSEYESQYLDDSPEYGLPFSLDIKYDLQTSVKDDAWLWDSRVLENSELDAVYTDKLKTTGVILKDIIDYEEGSFEGKYSTRGNTQPPIQIIES